MQKLKHEASYYEKKASNGDSVLVSVSVIMPAIWLTFWQIPICCFITQTAPEFPQVQLVSCS